MEKFYWMLQKVYEKTKFVSTTTFQYAGFYEDLF